ncbi:MAG TPA: response regulator transcription factor [Vicinamibacterales bacterium]|nr:response regulator transcription factor [Vicinamibacterales bacterium]
MTVVVVARDSVRRRALIQEAESAGWTVRADVPAEASLSAEDLDGVAAVILDADDAKSDDAKSDDSMFDDRLSDAFAEPLTPREQEVLEHIVAGRSNRQIASELGISEHTVKFHVSAVLGKLGVSSRAAAIRRGVRRGLVTL